VDFRKRFIVLPDSKVKLRELDAAYKGEHQKSAVSELERNVKALAHLQYKLYAEGKRSLLLVLQGLDASGKDGVIRHIFNSTNPQGVNVTSFKEPSREELAHDFLWRAHCHAPSKGEIMIFNRSYYENVLVVRVHNIVPKEIWSARYGRIRDFETLLTQAGTRVLKFYLHISPEEQLARFKERLDDPHRNWKISNSDYTEREYWPAYLTAFEDAIRETTTADAPWYVIPSNHKWFRDLAISSILIETLEEMNLQLPQPSVDLRAIRVRYHEAKVKQERDGNT
jgi:PPK2 family polyphosphate:nucleotide phosphotransferase